MRERNRRQSSLFLMELIIMVFFFALAAAICLKLYAGARSISENTRILSIGSAKTESVAAALRDDPTDPVGSLTRIADGGNVELTGDAASGQAVYYYDSDWKLCRNEDAKTAVLVSWNAENHMLTADISINKIHSDSGEIQTLSTSRVEKHIPFSA